MARPPELTTTTYAILGHLALRDWTMYELARQMRRNVHLFFSRAESGVYAEPKKLVALGLATERKEATGRRTRTIYAITDEGREALRVWLDTPIAKDPHLEFEGMLRVFLSNLSNPEGLRRTFDQIREDALTRCELAFRVRGQYLAGTAPFQHLMLYRSFAHDFLMHFIVMTEEWADRSLQRLDAWEHQDDAERLAGARRVFEEAGADWLARKGHLLDGARRYPAE